MTINKNNKDFTPKLGSDIINNKDFSLEYGDEVYHLKIELK